jgi:hypothetical protein
MCARNFKDAGVAEEKTRLCDAPFRFSEMRGWLTPPDLLGYFWRSAGSLP